MFDRAASSLIAAAAICAAAVVAVVAAGFSLYALLLPPLGAAGAAAVVACVSAVIVALYAIVMTLRAKARERDSQSAHAQLLEALPVALGGLTRDRPMLTMAVSVLGGALVARHPQMARDLLAIVAAWTSRGR